MASALKNVDVIVFLSTTGDILNPDQQSAFEKWIAKGGGYVGIHAAADTEYDWPYYGQEVVGAWFKSHPKIQKATVNVEDRKFPATSFLPAKWERTDEWYNYRTNPRGQARVRGVTSTGSTPRAPLLEPQRLDRVQPAGRSRGAGLRTPPGPPAFRSLVPQRLDGIQPARLKRRVEAERHADEGGEEERERDGARVHEDGPAGELRDGLLDPDAEADAEYAPRQGKDDFDTPWLRKYTGGWDGTNETKDYFERLTFELRKAYSKMKKPILMVPVGHVMYELNQRMKAGEVPGYRHIKEVFADGIHLNNVGSYIVGCTFFATLYKENPKGLPGAPYKVTDPKLAEAIQETVWKVVSTHELAGISRQAANPAYPPSPLIKSLTIEPERRSIGDRRRDNDKTVSRHQEPAPDRPPVEDAPPPALQEARETLEPVPGETAPLDHVTEDEIRRDPLGLAKIATDEEEEAPGPPG